MPTQSTSKAKSNAENVGNGIWIGIDLGTTNSTAAFYSPAKSKAKLIRFQPTYAKRNANNKYGRILPSAIYYSQKDGEAHVQAIGIEAVQSQENQESEIDLPQNPKNNQEEKEGGHVVLSSVKRIWGMDQTQIQNEILQDPNMIKDCPFDVIISSTSSKNDHNAIQIPICDEISVSPMDVAELLLKTIRLEATAYFSREKEAAVGMITPNEPDNTEDETQTPLVRNCILTVPAHFSRNRREQMVQAAKNVGFDGYVGTMVESTAAAMAYGLFVAPMKEGVIQGRKIMVFDMGGGTTDVTIAQMIQSDGGADPSFKVLGTAGERRLGGDDMDLKLVEFIKGEVDDSAINKNTNMGRAKRNQIRMACRNAKEKLCGDGKDELPAASVDVRVDNQSITITQETFYEAISCLVDKASNLVQIALDECKCSADSIDEVILVGGATRTPPIRTMLQSTFPKNELCYSIDPYAAVAQGAAIQGALVSNLVPRHELRNAMMLDALPHPIGVLLGGEEEMYVPILERGMELPAMSYASFHLSDVRQKGVTIIAVEDVEEDLPLERIGEFHFLLHRLSDEKYDTMKDKGRTIDVGMTVETNGKFIVSIFDKNDPDHVRKKERYQEWKRRQKGEDQDQKPIYSLADLTKKHKNRESLGKEELLLIMGCAVLFFCYVTVKMSFQEVEEGSNIL